MLVSTWNVNSVNVRLPNILQYLDQYKPDVLCLQELKCTEDKYPDEHFKEVGYASSQACQKTYNGVSILSKCPQHDIDYNPVHLNPDEMRSIAATINKIRIINFYVVNGQGIDSDKYTYKLDWLREAKKFIKSEVKSYKKVIVLGDFNIAPNKVDSYDQNYQELLCSEQERKALKEITNLGLTDCYQPENELSPFTWWDYRGGNFYKDIGFRIDLILASKPVHSMIKHYGVHRDTRHKSWCNQQPKTSDHAPVFIDF